jgi:hypothetical protein
VKFSSKENQANKKEMQKEGNDSKGLRQRKVATILSDLIEVLEQVLVESAERFIKLSRVKGFSLATTNLI